ncbi:hypothetical protein [Thalassoroseus pseudoceratinae]|uniref:hypothetical protein n=1 Tax=Thalassoroseus pseudoceratinae TaxID=2713176 RepID=UPI001F0E2474
MCQLSASGSETEAQPEWYHRARYRPLSAEELLESWVIASGHDQVLKNTGQASDERLSYRRITWTYLLNSFGEPNDGVGNFQGGLQEHLYLNYGQVHTLISDQPGSLLHRLNNSEDSLETRVEQLYLQVLSRKPILEETQPFFEFLSLDDDQKGRLHDAIWTLMTCSEFQFNH